MQPGIYSSPISNRRFVEVNEFIPHLNRMCEWSLGTGTQLHSAASVLLVRDHFLTCRSTFSMCTRSELWGPGVQCSSSVPQHLTDWRLWGTKVSQLECRGHLSFYAHCAMFRCPSQVSHRVETAKKNLKQGWLPAFWEKIQNTQEVKRRLFNWMKQDRICKFSRKSFFKLHTT